MEVVKKGDIDVVICILLAWWFIMIISIASGWWMACVNSGS